MADDDIPGHPHRPLLVAAYRQFRTGGPQSTLDMLEPVLAVDPIVNRPSAMAGVLWGLAGDCHFRLGQVDRGFEAYRRAITFDDSTGCLTLFACEVARYRRADLAGEAIDCLRAARAADGRALRRFPVHFLWHSLGAELLYHRFVRVPLASWRLRRLTPASRVVSHFRDPE